MRDGPPSSGPRRLGTRTARGQPFALQRGGARPMSATTTAAALSFTAVAPTLLRSGSSPAIDPPGRCTSATTSARSRTAFACKSWRRAARPDRRLPDDHRPRRSDRAPAKRRGGPVRAGRDLLDAAGLLVEEPRAQLGDGDGEPRPGEQPVARDAAPCGRVQLNQVTISTWICGRLGLHGFRRGEGNLLRVRLPRASGAGHTDGWACSPPAASSSRCSPNVFGTPESIRLQMTAHS